jgi:hypothetical protein
MIISDLIIGRENPRVKLYDPSRKSPMAAFTFAKQNERRRAIYRWITPGEVRDAEEIQPGTGAVIRRGLSKIALYRDPSGKLHERSAGVPAFRLYRGLEQNGEQLGLPLSWFRDSNLMEKF